MLSASLNKTFPSFLIGPTAVTIVSNAFQMPQLEFLMHQKCVNIINISKTEWSVSQSSLNPFLNEWMNECLTTPQLKKPHSLMSYEMCVFDIPAGVSTTVE